MARASARSLGALGERNFRRFFLGYATSLLGSAMVPVALTFAVLDEHRSAGDLGDVLGAETVPLVALLLVGGVVADRIPRRVSMLGADAVRCCSEGVLAALLLTGTPPLWVLVLLAGVLGAGQAFFNPAMTGLMPEMVSGAHLQQANALRGVATSGAQILGPAVAGVLVAAGGAGWAIAIDAASYAVSTACLARLEVPARAAPTGSVVAQLARGWREFRSRRWVCAIVAQFATYNAVSFAPFMVLGAVVAHTRLGGAGAWGAILATFGAGSVLGGLACTRVTPRRPLVVGTLGAALLGLPEALVAVPAPTVAIAAAAGVAGVGLAVFDTFWETSLQSHVPGEVLSRVSAYDWLGSVAFVPVGYLLASPLAAAIGVRGALLLAASWAVASCAAVLTSRSVRTLRPGSPA